MWLVSASDREIVEALIEGQPGSWDLFVARYAGTVRAAAARILTAQTGRAREAEVDDRTEDVFLALLEHDRRLLRRYDHRYPLRAYLAVIARTAVHRELRRRRAKALTDAQAADLLDSASGIETRGARAEVLGVVRHELGALSAREQTLLRLYYFEGRDYKAIAAELSISINSVGAALSRARANLAKGLRARKDLTESDLKAI
jgi:RNA polymerase sigma-70 factor (ECF subfamily)